MFGDGYEKPLLVSPWLAALLKRLDRVVHDAELRFPEKIGQPIFDTDDLLAMGDAVIEEAPHRRLVVDERGLERRDAICAAPSPRRTPDRSRDRVHRKRHQRRPRAGPPPGRGRQRAPGSARDTADPAISRGMGHDLTAPAELLVPPLRPGRAAARPRLRPDRAGRAGACWRWRSTARAAA
ncbi:hypothetical protein ACRAWD_01145 [Caulobacter segnis]